MLEGFRKKSAYISRLIGTILNDNTCAVVGVIRVGHPLTLMRFGQLTRSEQVVGKLKNQGRKDS